MSRTPNAKNWTSERSEQLRGLWEDERLSSGTIASLMGVTRNAVIGRVSRMKLKKHARRAYPLHRASPTPRPSVKNKVTSFKLLPESIPGDTRRLRGDAWKPLPGTVPVTMLDLGANMCRWPVGEDRPLLFCGAHADGAYCEQHRDLSVGRGTPSEREAHKWKAAA